MSKEKNPYIRVPLAIAFIAMLFFLPTREFLKLTFLLGCPFILILGYMVKRPRYSLTWILAGLLLLPIVGYYVYSLIHLPERVQVHAIISEGAGLVAEGRFDEAIAEYEKLEEFGHVDRMEKAIAKAERERDARQQLIQAQELLNSGHEGEARKILEAIPVESRAGQEASKILRGLK
ncbi:MAG: hypothetical protein GX133_09020 [Syntrophomonadaceae bacterium]|nr:hypothetical protein [Syntrophomonadaceae bacterium]